METYRIIVRDPARLSPISPKGRVLEIFEWNRPGSTWTAARVKRWLRRMYPAACLETLRVRGTF